MFHPGPPRRGPVSRNPSLLVSSSGAILRKLFLLLTPPAVWSPSSAETRILCLSRITEPLTTVGREFTFRSTQIHFRPVQTALRKIIHLAITVHPIFCFRAVSLSATALVPPLLVRSFRKRSDCKRLFETGCLPPILLRAGPAVKTSSLSAGDLSQYSAGE